MKNSILFLIATLFFWTYSAHARQWEKIEIPHATCGNGEPYSVFYDRRDTAKLIIEFMGGGACWSEQSCYVFPMTSISPPAQPMASVVTKELPLNPFNQFSALYFPYCTGDVHAGQHVAQYRRGQELHHNGYNNVLLALEYLRQQNRIDFLGVQDAMVWGASAGAIGALVHAGNIEMYLSPLARKTLISDSPGLHFGKNFWKKFSKDMNHDFQTNFGKMGLAYSTDDGLLAPYMGPVFQRMSFWSVGIMQATRDRTMSLFFGDIFPASHRNLVLGPTGIVATASGYSNVKTWINESTTHTFLLDDKSANLQSVQKEKAMDFALRVYGFQL